MYSSSACTPAYTLGVIHFSSASQPPRFTPRHLSAGFADNAGRGRSTASARSPIAALAITALVKKSRRFIGLPSTSGEKESSPTTRSEAPFLVFSIQGSVTLPPLAESVSPVMKLDSSLKRKRMTEAISGGWPIRPSGVSATMRFIDSSERTWAISVSIRPGATQLTRTLCGANASPQHRVSAMTPAFEEA